MPDSVYKIIELVGSSPESWEKSAEIMNELGAKAKANGLQFLWHNHDKEFHQMEKGLPFDYLMENTDPKLVQCELDIYWVKKGGADPLEFMKKYAGRFPILHIKDMAAGPEQDFICPGRGIIDFVPIFAEAKNRALNTILLNATMNLMGLVA